MLFIIQPLMPTTYLRLRFYAKILYSGHTRFVDYIGRSLSMYIGHFKDGYLCSIIEGLVVVQNKKRYSGFLLPELTELMYESFLTRCFSEIFCVSQIFNVEQGQNNANPPTISVYGNLEKPCQNCSVLIMGFSIRIVTREQGRESANPPTASASASWKGSKNPFKIALCSQ